MPQNLQQSALATLGHAADTTNIIFKALKSINCTIIESDYVESGYPLPNGTYTGLIGMMQRREFDLAFIAARPDSLPYEPVLIGPMVLEADAVLITAKSRQKPINRELLELVNDVDFLVYVYLLMMIVVFCISYMITTYGLEMAKEDQDDWDPISVAKHSYEVVYNSLAAIVDQQNFSPVSDSSKILVFFFVAGLFFGIFGIFLNKLGADLIRKNGPPNIDSIEHFANNITHTKPVIIKKLYLLSLLKTESKMRKDSTLGRLWSMMEKEQNETVFDIDMEAMRKGDTQDQMKILSMVSDLLRDVEDRTKALILPRSIAVTATVVGCIINPINISRLHVSTESFAQGTLNSLMSHGIDPLLRKMWEYFGKNIYEFDLLKGANFMTAMEVPQMVPGTPAKYGLSAMECIDYKPLSILKNDPEFAAEYIHDEDSFEPFTLFHLTSLFKLLLIGWASALVVCVLEILYFHSKRLINVNVFAIRVFPSMD